MFRGYLSGDVISTPITMMCRSALLNTEWLRFHSLFEHSVRISTATTNSYEKFRKTLIATRLNEE